MIPGQQVGQRQGRNPKTGVREPGKRDTVYRPTTGTGDEDWRAERSVVPTHEQEVERIRAQHKREQKPGAGYRRPYNRRNQMAEITMVPGAGVGRNPGRTMKKGVIPGGRAEAQGRTPSDFPEDKVRAGQRVEAEHTKDPRVQREIASDHLAEDPAYYEKLRIMERGPADARSKLEQAVVRFLEQNPEPRDADYHRLAERLKVEPDVLEAVAYKLLGKVVHKSRDPNIQTIDRWLSTESGERREERTMEKSDNLAQALDILGGLTRELEKGLPGTGDAGNPGTGGAGRQTRVVPSTESALESLEQFAALTKAALPARDKKRRRWESGVEKGSAPTMAMDSSKSMEVQDAPHVEIPRPVAGETQKSLESIDSLEDYLVKAVTGGMVEGHEYIKREGAPGHYQYTYAADVHPRIAALGEDKDTFLHGVHRDLDNGVLMLHAHSLDAAHREHLAGIDSPEKMANHVHANANNATYIKAKGNGVWHEVAATTPAAGALARTGLVVREKTGTPNHWLVARDKQWEGPETGQQELAMPGATEVAPKEETPNPATMSLEEKVAYATKLGEAASAAGKPAAPALNKEVLSLIDPSAQVGDKSTIKLFDAYTKAWHKHNLAKPVPGVTDSPEWKATAEWHHQGKESGKVVHTPFGPMGSDKVAIHAQDVKAIQAKLEKEPLPETFAGNVPDMKHLAEHVAHNQKAWSKYAQHPDVKAWLDKIGIPPNQQGIHTAHAFYAMAMGKLPPGYEEEEAGKPGEPAKAPEAKPEEKPEAPKPEAPKAGHQLEDLPLGPKPEKKPEAFSGKAFSAEDVVNGKAPYKVGEALHPEHKDEASAYVIDDYPYGHDRTQMRVWHEKDKDEKTRFVSQTKNPKTGKWNAPKKSTYDDGRVAVFDDKGHLVHHGYNLAYRSEGQIPKFLAKWGGHLSPEQVTHAELMAHYDQLKAGGVEHGEALHAAKLKWADNMKKRGILQAHKEQTEAQAKAKAEAKAQGPTGAPPEIPPKVKNLGLLDVHELAKMGKDEIHHHFASKDYFGRQSHAAGYKFLAKKAGEVGRHNLATQYKHAASIATHAGGYAQEGEPKPGSGAIDKFLSHVKKHGTDKEAMDKSLDGIDSLEEFLMKAETGMERAGHKYKNRKLGPGGKFEYQYGDEPGMSGQSDVLPGEQPKQAPTPVAGGAGPGRPQQPAAPAQQAGQQSGQQAAPAEQSGQQPAEPHPLDKLRGALAGLDRALAHAKHADDKSQGQILAEVHQHLGAARDHLNRMSGGKLGEQVPEQHANAAKEYLKRTKAILSSIPGFSKSLELAVDDLLKAVAEVQADLLLKSRIRQPRVDGGYSRTEVWNNAAHEMAVQRSRMQRRVPDVVLLGGTARIVRKSEVQDEGKTWQRPGSIAQYSDHGDLAAVRSVLGGDYYLSGERPTMDVRPTGLTKSEACAHCGARVPVMLASCQVCGTRK